MHRPKSCDERVPDRSTEGQAAEQQAQRRLDQEQQHEGRSHDHMPHECETSSSPVNTIEIQNELRISQRLLFR